MALAGEVSVTLPEEYIPGNNRVGRAVHGDQLDGRILEVVATLLKVSSELETTELENRRRM
jgi:hypothetical protein